ncbi:MAG: ABC transporter substrate-binding protein [Candidatus Falkowbacteria bacterium]|nr:ABC transporter substrate-binding protein [Candidatus Falkowbacteria bacterium]
MSFLSRWFAKKPTPKNLDQTLVLHLSKSRIPGPRQIKYLGRFLSPLERFLVYVSLVLAIGALGFIATVFYKNNIVLVPGEGGSYTEGLVGNPQYINPLYASLNDADADLEKLIFSRLFTKDNQGRAVPDLVDSYTLSPDKKTYTLKLKPANFNDGSPVTADDVVFTFNTITNPDYKSPLRDNFSGVAVAKVDDQTISFSLSEAYRDFPRLLDFGVMASASWDSVSSDTATLTELNIKPIGSGPYKFKSLSKSKDGTIRSYVVEKNAYYYGNKAHLDEITFKFFPSNEEMIAALNNGQLNGLSYITSSTRDLIIAKNSLNYHQIALPELSAVFFNLNSKGVISDKKIRQALSAAIDQRSITKDSVGLFGIASETLLPSFSPGNDTLFRFDLEKAKKLLADAGWQKRTITDQDIQTAKADPKASEIVRVGAGEWLFKDNKPLIISLSSSDVLKPVAEEIIKNWNSLNIKTELSTKPINSFEKDVINSKQFEVALYSMTIDNGDPYSLWQKGSSTNISSWQNSNVDKALEEARLGDDKIATDRYHLFLVQAAEDVPASPIFWRAYVYPQTKKLKGFALESLADPSERFEQANSWYINTNRQLKR